MRGKVKGVRIFAQGSVFSFSKINWNSAGRLTNLPVQTKIYLFTLEKANAVPRNFSFPYGD